MYEYESIYGWSAPKPFPFSWVAKNRAVVEWKLDVDQGCPLFFAHFPRWQYIMGIVLCIPKRSEVSNSPCWSHIHHFFFPSSTYAWYLIPPPCTYMPLGGHVILAHRTYFPLQCSMILITTCTPVRNSYFLMFWGADFLLNHSLRHIICFTATYQIQRKEKESIESCKKFWWRFSQLTATASTPIKII